MGRWKLICANCGLSICVLLAGWPIIFVFGAFFFDLLYLEYGPPADISTVSGFYGPGAFLAWLLVLLLTAASHLVKNRIDAAGFIATFAYSGVAAVDALVRVAKRDRGAQYHSAIVVCIYSTVTTAACLFTSSVHSSRKQFWVWHLLFLVCGIPTLVSNFLPCVSVVGVSKALPIAGAEVCFLRPQLGQYSTLQCAFFAGTTAVLPLLMYSKGGYNGPLSNHFICDENEVTARFAFPKSPAKIVDLDQAAALGAAILGAAYSLGLLERIFRKRTGIFRRASRYLTWWKNERSEEELPLQEIHHSQTQ